MHLMLGAGRSEKVLIFTPGTYGGGRCLACGDERMAGSFEQYN